MKEFLPKRKEDAIKKIAGYFSTTNFETVGIVFEKQSDATAFLDEVKNLLNKEDFEVKNKKQIESNTNVRVITDNCRNKSKILSGYTCSKLFIEKNCFLKYFDDIYDCCVGPQSTLKPENVENYLIIN